MDTGEVENSEEQEEVEDKSDTIERKERPLVEVNRAVKGEEETHRMAPLQTRKPDSFDGTTPETWPSWVAKFEAYVTANSEVNISEGDLDIARLRAMPAFLTQHAFQMYEELLPDQKNTYKNLVAGMDGKMDIGERPMSWITQMRRAERKPGESIEKFIGRLTNLAKQGYPTATTEERAKHINECFILGQQSGLLFELLKQGGTNLETNKKNAKLYEAATDLAVGRKNINLVQEEEAKYGGRSLGGRSP